MNMTPREDTASEPTSVEFFFDYICPYAYQTSIWIREVRAQTGLNVTWRFFSLEEVNRAEGGRHPWERDLAYGWTPMRVAAWLRRRDMEWCDRWYAACGKALHEDGRRPYDREVALQLLAEAGLPGEAWDEALADPTTHDDLRADHAEAVGPLAGFGVPIIVIPGGRPVFGPVVLPAPRGERALDLWRLTVAYARFPGLYEMKTPKTDADMAFIGNMFAPYLEARQWPTIMNPAR